MAARAARGGESGVPVAMFGKMLSLARGHLKTHRGGCTMLPHQITTSMMLCLVEMAQTCGGTTAPVEPPRVYTNPQGVKVRKIHGGYVYQPPSLKVCSYLALDRFRSKAGLPRSRLYEGVQKFMDHLIDQVEDRLMGLDPTGTH